MGNSLPLLSTVLLVIELIRQILPISKSGNSDLPSPGEMLPNLNYLRFLLCTLLVRQPHWCERMEN